jgi:hypothetical protein
VTTATAVATEYTEMIDGLSLIRALAAMPSVSSASKMLFGFQ